MLPPCIPDFHKFFLELCDGATKSKPDFDVAFIKEHYDNYTEEHDETLATFLILGGKPVFAVINGRPDEDMPEIFEKFSHVRDWQLLGDFYLDEPKQINKWLARDWEAVCLLLMHDLIKP